MTKEEVTTDLAGILAMVSSYSQARIKELIEYSEDSNLQLIALMSPSNADVLAAKVYNHFDRLESQQDLLDALFAKIKTVEALIDYVYKFYSDEVNEQLHGQDFAA